MNLSTSARGRRILGMTVVMCGVLVVLPASGFANTKFGANLNPGGTVTQPTAVVNGFSCFDADPDLTVAPCTRVAVQYGDTGAAQGHVKAPRSGTLKKLKIVASGPGEFKPFLARVKDVDSGSHTGKALVHAGGKLRTYQGDDTSPYTIESFPFIVKVRKGDRLAVKSERTSFEKCQTGSLEQLLFQPPLVLFDPFEPSDGDDDCTLLIQAVYK
jgi:hypothetical protein